jgi:hypothetical protein
MIYKFLFLFFSFSFFPIFITAQNDLVVADNYLFKNSTRKDKKIDEIKNNSLNLELGGLGIIWSINYERKFRLKNDLGLAVQLGFGSLKFNSNGNPNNDDVRLPMHLNIFKSYKKNVFDFGFGFIPYELSIKKLFNWDDSDIALGVEMGYRRYLKNVPLFYGVSFNPIIYDNKRFDFTPWGALKTGFVF